MLSASDLLTIKEILVEHLNYLQMFDGYDNIDRINRINSIITKIELAQREGTR